MIGHETSRDNVRGKEKDSTTNETGKVLENQWGNTGMLASTNEGYFQFQARPGNKERNTNPQVKGGVTSEGEFGYRYVKIVLMDTNKDLIEREVDVVVSS